MEVECDRLKYNKSESSRTCIWWWVGLLKARLSRKESGLGLDDDVPGGIEYSLSLWCVQGCRR